MKLDFRLVFVILVLFGFGCYFLFIQHATNLDFETNGIITKGVVVGQNNSQDNEGSSKSNPIVDYYTDKGKLYHFTAQTTEFTMKDSLDVIYINNNPLKVRLYDKVSPIMGYIQGGIFLGIALLFTLILFWRKR